MHRSLGMLDYRKMIKCTGPRVAQVSWDARSQGNEGMYRSQGCTGLLGC